MKKVMHLITGLNVGGAEMMLFKLLSNIDRERFEPVVISLLDRGPLVERFEASGIPVYTIGLKPGFPVLRAVIRLAKIVRSLRPDIIQGWLPHGNLAALFAYAISFGRVPFLWNIRQTIDSIDNRSDNKCSTAFIIRLGAKLSFLPRKIIYNSKSGMLQHEAIGYRAGKSVVIPNGFDTELFKPSEEANYNLRKDLGLSSSAFLIGLIARYHPMKDHYNFLKAASYLSSDYPDARFVLVGANVNEQNLELMKIIHELGLMEKIYLLGERSDIPRLTASLDIATSSSSSSEGFPNSVGEAMACGVPCVVTDVSDSAWIVGNAGRVVPPRDSIALAKAWSELIEMGLHSRKGLGETARKRVLSEFSINKIVKSYEALYLEILNG